MSLIITLILSFLLIAFFSASEIAFSAAHRAKIKLWKKSKKIFGGILY